MARLTEVYKNDVAPALMQKYSYKSPMQIPKVEKIVLQVGELSGAVKTDVTLPMQSVVTIVLSE